MPLLLLSSGITVSYGTHPGKKARHSSPWFHSAEACHSRAMRPSLRSLRISSILLSTFSTALLAQLPVAPRLQTGFDAIHESELRSDLTFIAGDGLAGRMSLQPGDDAAAEWVVSKFAKSGLQPAATHASGKPSFLQSVPPLDYKPPTPPTTPTS